MTVEWVTIGKVTAPHGVRGEVRVYPLTEFPDRFLDLARVFLCRGEERSERRVSRVKGLARGLFLLKLEGIDTRDEAERWRGAEVQVPRAEAVPLPPGRYYVFELVARAGGDERRGAGGPAGGRAGHRGQRRVRRPLGRGPRDPGAPPCRHVVLSIDPEEGTIVIDPIPGLLEE